uniref:Uncharacterized protein n=1 Tax=Anguilla anguilla TaxID=7936 RepID=A0A0E9PJF5_ANGAN
MVKWRADCNLLACEVKLLLIVKMCFFLWPRFCNCKKW